jgi:hypothetical protein
MLLRELTRNIRQINEALPLSVAKPYVKKWDPDTYAYIFRQSGYKTDRNAYRLIVPTSITADEGPAYPNPIVVNYVKRAGYEIVDYQSNRAKKTDGDKREFSIGKIVNADPRIKQLFDNDPSRKGARGGNYVVVVSRHPYDVIGMSSGRGWTSCMGLPKTCSPSDENYEDGGSNHHYLEADVTEGTIVAYLVNTNKLNKTDDILKSPTARIAIKPYINRNNGEVMLVASTATYDSAVPGFREAVVKIVDRLNYYLDSSAGLFAIKHKLYPEEGDPGTVVNINFNELTNLNYAIPALNSLGIEEAVQYIASVRHKLSPELVGQLTSGLYKYNHKSDWVLDVLVDADLLSDGIIDDMIERGHSLNVYVQASENNKYIPPKLENYANYVFNTLEGQQEFIKNNDGYSLLRAFHDAKLDPDKRLIAYVMQDDPDVWETIMDSEIGPYISKLVKKYQLSEMYARIDKNMLLREFFNSTYDITGTNRPDSSQYTASRDSSIMRRSDTRKTRLTLKQINQLRKASEQHIIEQERDLIFVRDMYSTPPQQPM